MMTSVISGFITGVFYFFFICGTSILLFGVIQYVSKVLKGRNRWRRIYDQKSMSDSISMADLPFVKRFSDLMDFAGVKMKTEYMFLIMLFLGVVSFLGLGAGIELLKISVSIPTVVNDSTGVLIVTIAISSLMASLPLFYVIFKAQRKRHRIALRMIVLVQNIIGNYQPLIAMSEVIARSERGMPEEVKDEWSRLSLSLHMKPLEEALLEFSNRLKNKWAEQLVDTLLIGSQYGVNIKDSLHLLVRRMQTSKRNEEKRIAMVTVYRLGTVIMVFANIGFVAINIYADGSNYEVYFVNPVGRMLLLVSIFMLFVSLILVARSGKRSF